MSGAGRGIYRLRYAEDEHDLARAQALRWRCFRAEGAAKRPAAPGAIDGDAYDGLARHALVEDAAGRLVCTFRVIAFADGAGVGASYSAQFYGLAGLARYPGPKLELGRFCIEGPGPDPAILRLAWGGLAEIVERGGVTLVFGCSSFAGPEAAAHADAFALLKDRHLAPRRWLPRVKAAEVFRFARKLAKRKPDLAAAMRAMPPLLRSYLAMGGWVSDHAVVDRDLGTLHVFTGLEIGAIPPARLRALRAAPG